MADVPIAPANATSTLAADNTRDEFYVGYLPLPVALRRVLIFAVGAALWMIAGFAFVWARAQNDPGAAVWSDAMPVTVTGRLEAMPYPMLVTSERTEAGEAVVYLLVEMGKRGATSRAMPPAGQIVVVTGYTLERDGRRIIELEDAADAIKSAAASTSPSVGAIEPRDLGPVTLVGEIVDLKCFLGAMKPGEGKTHKACATVCIRGGIPPTLVTRDGRGVASYFVLTDELGQPLDERLWPLVADPVQVKGRLMAVESIRQLRVGIGDIARIP